MFTSHLVISSVDFQANICQRKISINSRQVKLSGATACNEGRLVTGGNSQKAVIHDKGGPTAIIALQEAATLQKEAFHRS